MGRETEERWWAGWAPYWDKMEDRHLGTEALERLTPMLSEPVLVVGAGHGLLVEALERKGVRAVGLDRDRAMAAMGCTRRGLAPLCADGGSLPLASGSFSAVILSSGVLDYGADAGERSAILAEARRVARPGGEVLAAFYRLDPALQGLYRRLGLLSERTFHMGRLFEMGELARKKPLSAIPRLSRWSGQGLLRTSLLWFRCGVAMPRRLKEERRIIEEIFAAASRDGVDRGALIAQVPDEVPHWDEAEVAAALARSGEPAAEIIAMRDCLVARLRPRP